jgi:NhaP-type Na+/H+ or K+/H+ antiporter
MITDGSIILMVGLIIFLAHFFVVLFEKTRIPDVFFLLVLGVILGPVLKVVSPQDFGKIGHVFTTITVVVILFEAGLYLSYRSLKGAFRETLFITLLSFVVTAALLSTAYFELSKTSLVSHSSLTLSLFVGTLLASTAPTIVIPILSQLKISDSTRVILTLESALGEAISIVIALGILTSAHLNKMSVGQILGKLFSSFLLAVVVGWIGGYFWSLVLNKIRQLQNSSFTTFSFLFVLYGIAEFLGYSGPVAALMFGITMGNIQLFKIPWVSKKIQMDPVSLSQNEKLFFSEIVFLVKTFFFVYIGLSIVNFHLSSIEVVLVLILVILMARFLTIRFLGRKLKLNPESAALMSFMIPRGTAAAALAAVPLQLGIPGGGLVQEVLYLTIILSIFFTSFFVYFEEKEGFSGFVKRCILGYPGSGTEKSEINHKHSEVK